MDLIAPHDESGLATAIADAGHTGEPMLVCGNGTKLGMLRPVQAAQRQAPATSSSSSELE